MRSEQLWESKVKEMYISTQFPPRIRVDLRKISPPSLQIPISSSFIYGKTNVGKTILACFMMLEEQKQIYLQGGPKTKFDRCIFTSTTDLVNELKGTFSSNEERTEQDILNFYCDLHLLVLDDFGINKPSDWILQTLYSIINHRYEYLKPTIITSNIDLAAIAEVLGDDRITSRIERSYQLIRKIPYKA